MRNDSTISLRGRGARPVTGDSYVAPTTWFLTKDDGTVESRQRRYDEFVVRHGKYEIVEDNLQLASILARIQEYPDRPVGFDIETALKGDRIQVTDGYIRTLQFSWINPDSGFAQTWVVDAERADASLLKGMLHDDSREKIMHWSPFEQEWSRVRLGHSIYPAWDTAFAWQSIQKKFRAMMETEEGRAQIEELVPGWEQAPAKLSSVTEVLLGMSLPKEQQTSPWGAATLSEEQYQYAALDATVMLPLRPRLTEIAKAINVEGKINWRCNNTRKEIARRWNAGRLAELDESRDIAWRMANATTVHELERVGATVRQARMPQADRQTLRECYRLRREELQQ